VFFGHVFFGCGSNEEPFMQKTRLLLWRERERERRKKGKRKNAYLAKDAAGNDMGTNPT
jgi:hypothetical protein